jgi:HAD superfamily hydrolase (TIGR01509 family)
VQNYFAPAVPDFCHQRAISILSWRFGGTAPIDAVPEGRWRGAFVIIFDCNGVLVESERIAAAVAADEFTRVGIPITPDLVLRYFFGRRPADMFAAIEAAAKRKLPINFAARATAATLTRLRAELRAMPHAAHALTWLKCVASSSPLDRIRVSLETTGLARFFDHVFSASDVPHGKPAPDLFLHAASRMGVAAHGCIVVEDSPAGVNVAAAAGMTAIGFVGGSHAGGELGGQLIMAGAQAIVADLRHLKSTVVALRGW